VASVALFRASVTKAFTYDSHSLTSIYRIDNSNLVRKNAPSSGAISLTVDGVGFGSSSLTPRATLENSACMATVWISDTILVLKISKGNTVSVSAFLSVASQVAAMPDCFSFDTVTVSRAHPTNLPSTGAFLLAISGQNIGSHSSISSSSKIDRTTSSFSRWLSDTAFTLKTASGVRSMLNAVVSALMKIGQLSAAITYNAPSVSSAAGSNCAASGASSVSVSGVAFSLFGVSAVLRAGWLEGLELL
jgi:hypothetical protein